MSSSRSLVTSDAITRDEAARILSVHVGTVDRLIRRGVLTRGRKYANAFGMSSLDRSTITNIENGRRQRVGVDELLVLALALGVAPVHLLVPLGEEWYAIAPEHATGTSRVRQWVRGNFPVVGVPLAADPVARAADRETYLAQRPEQEWTPPPVPTPEEEEARKRERIRELLEAEEAGLVTIIRHPSGAWAVVPTGEVIVKATDDVEC